MKYRNKGYRTILVLLFIFAFGFAGCDTGGKVQNDKVVMIGDSIFALSGKIADDIEVYSNEIYRHYYFSGAQMIGGMVTPVPTQYENAKSADPNIRTVIMDGGGNDILIANQEVCAGDTITQECKDTLAPVFAEAERLFREMLSDGVQNVVYLGYYYQNENASSTMINAAGLDGVIDYAAAQSSGLCDKLNAEFGKKMGFYVDTRASFLGHDDEYINSDGVHPSATGSQVLADLIWDVMVTNNIEQNQ